MTNRAGKTRPPITNPGKAVAVIYCRVSTKEQVENFSLSTQEKACREYCARHGIEVDTIFVEEGESAKTAERHEFQKLLAYCRENKGRISWLVVYAVSRFARNTLDHHATEAFLAGLGVTLRSVTEPFDESAMGKAMKGMMAVWAELDNNTRAERTVAGMKAAIQSGKWPFKAPLGYLNGEGGQGSASLVHDEKRAPLVKMCFELFATGLHTKQHVLRRVTELGLTTAKGKRISPQSFEKLLRHRVYTGWIVVEKWNQERRGDFEPIISEEIFSVFKPSSTESALVSRHTCAITQNSPSAVSFAAIAAADR